MLQSIASVIASWEDEDLEIYAILGIITTIYAEYTLARSGFFVRERCNWEKHLESIFQEGSFQRYYRMSYLSFEILCGRLRKSLEPDRKQSMNRGLGEEPITTQLQLHCFLRFVAGGAVDDFRIVGGISRPSTYRVILDVATAINECAFLAYHMPWSDVDGLKHIARGFRRKSNRGIMKRCVGALDGFLLLIDSPTGVPNYHDFFSGHYHSFGINIQAIVDSETRFLEVAIAAPGAANDCYAITAAKLDAKIESLPEGMYVVADNAYCPSDRLLVPFSGQDKLQPRYDAFNFHLSQLRIKVEQAFGKLTNKFRILRRSMSIGLGNVRNLFLAMIRVHNFCINQNTPDDPETPEVMLTYRGQRYNYVPSDVTVIRAAGNSFLRDFLVSKMEQHDITRPTYNRKRNRSQMS
jgi:hypothetical protein